MSDGYITQLASINDTLKRLTSKVKDLKRQKKDIEERLRRWMEKNGYEECEGYKLTKLQPKPKAPRKKKADKKRDAIQLFADIGIDDPDELYEKLRETEKIKTSENTDE